MTCRSCQQPIDATAEGYYYLGERVYHMSCEPKQEPKEESCSPKA